MMELDLLQDPAATFRDWSVKREEPLPSQIRWLYVSVLGFYIQALFSCLFLGKFTYSCQKIYFFSEQTLNIIIAIRLCFEILP